MSTQCQSKLRLEVLRVLPIILGLFQGDFCSASSNRLPSLLLPQD